MSKSFSCNRYFKRIQKSQGPQGTGADLNDVLPDSATPVYAFTDRQANASIVVIGNCPKGTDAVKDAAKDVAFSIMLESVLDISIPNYNVIATNVSLGPSNSLYNSTKKLNFRKRSLILYLNQVYSMKR